MICSSKLGDKSTASEVADLYKDEVRDKTSKKNFWLHCIFIDIVSTVVITGVSPNGVGKAACAALAAYTPQRLIITGRDPGRLESMGKALRDQFAGLDVQTVEMDLASNESVKKAADEIEQFCAAGSGCIDILVNNAGVMCLPERQVTEEGIESHLQVNYVGHYLLTRLLLARLAKSPGGGRIVNVSSSAHEISPFRFSDPAFEKADDLAEEEQPLKNVCDHFDTPWTLGYSPLIAYGQSKAAVALHAVALSQSVGKGITAISVNPGSTSCSCL
jgi:NAD(P)-dependent dehydrogenase (short-subunit alcohol dehydrogenase family)